VSPTQTGDKNAPNLKMAEREDWTLFRSVDGLTQKAGVPTTKLRRLVLKELADNALDVGGKVNVGGIDVDTYFVEDDGPGLDGTPEEVASLFSIARPLRSSKLLRLPQRGALGNGLRVVAGTVLASGGSLTVITRNQRIRLRPESDGSTTVMNVTKAKQAVGTRVEIGFGKALPADPLTLNWAQWAIRLTEQGFLNGKSYDGKTSPYWYDPIQFHELLLAYGSQPLRSLIAQLDGCSGGKAGEILSAAKLDRATCGSVNRQQAMDLLKIVRRHARRVSAERLGLIGRADFLDRHYAIARSSVQLGNAEPQADIPFVVEAWARKRDRAEHVQVISIFVNRTPATGELNTYRDANDKQISIIGCGLGHGFIGGPTKGSYDVVLSVLTPYCPITSDGKTPDLAPFFDSIHDAAVRALKKAQRASPTERRVSQKDVVLENLDAVIASVSGGSEFRFNERQIFYQLRPIVLEETGQPLQIGNFKAIITDYENEHGEIEGMYREPRGSIYHPHRRETITLGTLMVEEYERPIWNFNKVTYIEKEGFSEALKETGWPERHDCMLMSSKGNTTRAAKDLVDKLTEHGEPCTIFCVHDADAYGTMIYQTFQEATRARKARKVKIVNIGLEPWEAIEMGLEVEDVEAGERWKPVADYVLERENGPLPGEPGSTPAEKQAYWERTRRAPNGETWAHWLQTHRVELNAMTTPEFIAWLDTKMEKHGKLIPPQDVLETELATQLETALRGQITERILREARFEQQVAAAMKTAKSPTGAALAKGIVNLFKRTPAAEWRAHIAAAVRKLIRK
jgi:hypothetical protein